MIFTAIKWWALAKGFWWALKRRPIRTARLLTLNEVRMAIGMKPLPTRSMTPREFAQLLAEFERSYR